MYHTPPLCFAQQILGRWPKDGGVKETEGLINSDCDSNKIKSQPLPISCLVALRGVTKQYGEKGCIAILLPCVLRSKI